MRKPASPLDRVMTMSWFRSVRDTNAEIRRMSLRELDPHVTSRHACHGEPVKDARRFLPVFKPGEFREGREATNLVSIECIEGDYDLGKHDLSWIVARLADAGLAAYIYPTSRHVPGRERYRIIAPLSKPMLPAEWKRHYEFLNKVLNRTLDMNAGNLSHIYYIGALDCGVDPEPFHLDGPRLDFIDKVLERRIDDADNNVSLAEGPDDLDDIAFDTASLQDPVDPETVRSMLEHIEPDEHETWIKVGLILHHEMEEAGFEIWDKWSSRSANYGETDKRWTSFAKPGGRRPIGIGSLIRLARKGGWTGEIIDPDIERMNRKHALVSTRGRTSVATFEKDGSISFGQLKDLHAFYENDRVLKSGGGTETVSRKWWRSSRRRTYPDGVTFTPGRKTPGKLNLWCGWKVEPDVEGSCELFLDHVRTIICDGDQAAYDYLIGWLAHLAQRPWEIPGVALVLRGKRGTGKDTFVDYLVGFIGEHHVPTVSQQDHVTGRFNARLENAVLLHMQEGMWGGDRRIEQILKYLITSGRIEIERKGIDSYGSPSCLRVAISGNEDWMVPASVDDRRFAVFDVSNARQKDTKYFGALREEMANGGPAALLHYLQNYDLADFDVRNPPATKGLLEQKLKSLRGLERWWFECLDKGTILNRANFSTEDHDNDSWESRSIQIAKEELRQRYAAWIASRKYDGDPVDEREFTKLLRRLLSTLPTKRSRVDGERRWDFVLPPLEVCRETFEFWIGHGIGWSE